MDLWTHGTLWRLHLQWASTSTKVSFSVWTYATLNARKSGYRPFWTHDSLIMNARKFFVRSWSDYRAFKTAYVQTVVRSKLPMIRLSCVQSNICPDYRAFKVAYVQTIVRSKLHMSRLSCVQKCLCPDLLWVPKENLCAAKLIICAFISRLSYVERALCPDFRAFKKAYVQNFRF